MVHAVVRGGVEQVFDPARQGPDQLGVQPELIQQIQRECAEHRRDRESQPHQRREEHRGGGDLAGPAQAVGRGQRVLLGRVMHGMVQPEPADAVVGAMHPVVAELLADEQQGPVPPAVHGDVGDAQPSHAQQQQTDHSAADRAVEQRAPEHVAERGPPRLPVVAEAVTHAPIALGCRQQRQQDRQRQQASSHGRSASSASIVVGPGISAGAGRRSATRPAALPRPRAFRPHSHPADRRPWRRAASWPRPRRGR